MNRSLRMKGPVYIGSRLETFIDDWIIARLQGATRVMHRPSPQNVALVFDEPWEGNTSGVVTVFQDTDLYRMYYRGSHTDYTEDEVTSYTPDNDHDQVVCYAESKDGINWYKPSLGLVEFNGSSDNNIIWDGPGSYTFAPFKDTNPDCIPDQLYKAIGIGVHKQGLSSFKSQDGINWSLSSSGPIITDGTFDSQNLAFWDPVVGAYREYHRDFYPGTNSLGNLPGRDIKTATSSDFYQWPEPIWLNYSPGRIGELYTSQIVPYYRAPHIYLGFPTRYTDRGWSESTKSLPQLDYRRIRASHSEREGTAITDGMLMSSRDGINFDIWPEAFLRPGLKKVGNWFYGDNYQNHGLIQTESLVEGSPEEISIFVSEFSHQSDYTAKLRRYTLRIDGFVSVQSNLAGGELITRPMIFEGNNLEINFSGSAGSSIRVEIQNSLGYAVPEFSMDKCEEIFGDDLKRIVSWRSDSSLASLNGIPVRLRIELKDADLYSFKFTKDKVHDI